MKYLAFIALLLAVQVHPVAGQNFNAGVVAYGRGDYTTALKHFKLLAEEGDAGAQNNLGSMYEQGRGVLQDLVEASKWFHLAAEQDHVFAKHNLGYMYESGRGVPKNYAEAVKWYRSAADQGDSAAQFDLCRLYWSGNGLPQNYFLAYAWCSIAAKGSPKNIKIAATHARNRIEKIFSPADLARAKAATSRIAQAIK